MSTIDQIRHGLGRAWDTLAEGWHQLRDRSADALTRFHPTHSGNVETREDQMTLHSPRWGLLTAEVREEEQQVVVRLEAPGMERDSFDIGVVDGRMLVVRGEKRAQRESNAGHYHIMECAYGSFERAIALPVEVSEDGAGASYTHGVLRVSLPKVVGGKRRRIEVQQG